MSTNYTKTTKYGVFEFQFLLDENKQIYLYVSGEDINFNRVQYERISMNYAKKGVNAFDLKYLHFYARRADGKWDKDMSFASRKKLTEFLCEIALQIFEKDKEAIYKSLTEEANSKEKESLLKRKEELKKELTEVENQLSQIV